MSKKQLRGHCPYCGREQAVQRGLMAKHGYTVEGGWFEGVCSGQHLAPIEQEEATVLQVIANVRGECVQLRRRADALESGTEKLEYAPISDMKNGKLCLFSELPPYRQKQVTERAVDEMRYRARNGDAHADYLDKIRNAVYGKPLREVELPVPPSPLRVGDRRENQYQGVLEAYEIGKGNVRWVNAQGKKGHMSTRSWRAMPGAKPAEDGATESITD